MRAHAIVLVALSACGGPQGTASTLKPLGDLVGSWRATGPSGARADLDLHADGTYAIAYPVAEGVPCVVTGTVHNDSDYLMFDIAPASPCGEEAFRYELKRQEVDQFSYLQNTDFYRDCDVPDCMVWTAVRTAGPLVTPELIETATRDRERRMEEEAQRPAWNDSDDSDEPYVPYEPPPPEDPEIAALKDAAASWEMATSSDSYYTVDAGSIKYSASWDDTPYVKASTAYRFTIIVSAAASDASAYLEMDGEVLEMESGSSDDGAFIVLHNWATIGDSGWRRGDEGGLTVHYTSSYDVPSILVIAARADS